jgi:hypothetical protein
VIANSINRSTAFLPDPRRDAKAVADSLRQVGFQSVERAMLAFGKIARGRDRSPQTLRDGRMVEPPTLGENVPLTRPQGPHRRPLIPR